MGAFIGVIVYQLRVLTLSGLIAATPVLAQDEPLWELGVGMGMQALADYRGSEQYQAQFLPIPYLVYRGEFLRADDDGIRGLFVETDNFELNVSADASLNGNSDDNTLRQGMPELDSAFEVGPSANFNLTGRDFAEGWSLRVPVRAVFVTDFSSIEHIGYLANPKFTYESLDWNRWDGSLNLGVVYGSNEYHDYYYSVAPGYATGDRPAYDAGSGYSGSYFKFGLSRREGRLWYGAYLRYDYLKGVEFARSPLMETNHFVTVGLGVSWVFAQSKTQVAPLD